MNFLKKKIAFVDNFTKKTHYFIFWRKIWRKTFTFILRKKSSEKI